MKVYIINHTPEKRDNWPLHVFRSRENAQAECDRFNTLHRQDGLYKVAIRLWSRDCSANLRWPGEGNGTGRTPSRTPSGWRLRA
jgi:hypothetical protein